MDAGRPILTRRSLLGAIAACAWVPAVPARAAPTRIAIVDWALLETSLALGIVPIAAVELVLFERLAVEPRVPASVVDLGLRGSINFELLASLAPDLVYGSNYSAWAHGLIARIAPVRTLTIFESGQPPFARAEAAMRAMADDLGVTARASAYIAETRAELAARSASLTGLSPRPVYLITIGDPRHFRGFGVDSMFGDVAGRLGVVNAWMPGSRLAASAPAGIEALAAVPEASIVILPPIPPDARYALFESALWQALPAVRAGRVVTLETVNPFGGLPAARRFARLFGEALRRLDAPA